MGLLAKKPSPPEAELSFDMFVGQQHTPDALPQVGRLPAEWFPQSGVQLTWPHAGTDWADMLPEVTDCYLRMAFEIASRQPLLIVTPCVDDVRRLLAERLPSRVTDRVRYVACPTNDTWARDHAFLTRIGQRGPELLDFGFNGWGNKFAADLDNAINAKVWAEGILHGTYEAHLDFVLEGGSIESDGCGTILTTAACLLNPNRNPTLSQAEEEQRLHATLGAERVLWLHHGHLAGDDTDSHIDTLARFVAPDAIAYVACTDAADEHFADLAAMAEELQAFTTADGRPYRLFPLPMPRPVFDADGERLPATYANFLIMNKAVLYPTYGQPDLDEAAAAVLRRAFGKYDVVGIDCRALIRQHGSLHCATMQYPRGVF